MSSPDLFVVSGPSGAGKTSLIRSLLGSLGHLSFSVSYTTRPRRQSEHEGVDYHFVDEEAFERMAAAGAFLEWARVHDHRYGTSARLVDEELAAGRDVVLDVDTQGAASVRRLRPEAVLIFILPPGADALRRRLMGRGLETADEAQRRLLKARAEMEKCGQYDYLVVNDDFARALRELESIVLAQRARRQRRMEACRGILDGFGVPGARDTVEG
ncbi:MAG TPA: guanylate kinase [Candidatus Polarisedimenticolia bacterium]|nr:guanylate kinase [Candidatus Polarisedimenticolia bacterium]